MIRTKITTIARCVGLIFFVAAGARAALITSPVGGQLIPIQDPGSRFYDIPITVAPGVTASSTNPDGSWIGPADPMLNYGLGTNGYWSPSISLIGVDTDLAGDDPYRV